MANSDSSYYIVRYDPSTNTMQYFSGADWYNVPSGSGINLADGKILVGNGSGLAAAVTMSGLATLSNAGVLTIAAGVAKLSDLSGTYTAPVALKPSVDGASAIRLNDSTGAVVFNIDSSNKRVGVNTASPSKPLHVNGAARFEGEASGGSLKTDALITVTPITNTVRDTITPTEGMVIYSSSDHALEFYNGTTWKVVATV